MYVYVLKTNLPILIIMMTKFLLFYSYFYSEEEAEAP